MNHRATAPMFPRLVVLLVATSQVLVPVGALAASTDLADVPISTQNRVAPNLLFTLDNSTSMQLGYIVRDAKSTQESGQQRISYAHRNCYKSASYNRMYYDPTLTYYPGKRADGSPYPNINFNAAWEDGYDITATYSVTGAGTYTGDPRFGWSLEGPQTTGPINLATSFQASFGTSGYDENEAGLWHYDTKEPAYYHVLQGAQPDPEDKIVCRNDNNYTKVVVSATSGPGGTDERQNFANWFSYHRFRMQIMKTGLSRAFAYLDGQKYRVGFATINDKLGKSNSGDDYFLPTDNFLGAHRSAWYDRVFSVFPVGGTPLHEAMRRAGEYYKVGRMPGSAYNIDPVQYACQRNYLIFVTDGYAREVGTIPVGNRDNIVPALPAPVPFDPVAGAPLVPGQPFPTPFHEGKTPSENSLADIAMNYWVTNLRPSMAMVVPTTELDPATWQHMTTYTIGLGVDGELPFTKKTYDKLVKGTLDWPLPVVTTTTEVDDMWHAAVNGHGRYFSAKSAAGLDSALTRSLAEVISGVGSGGSTAVSNPNVSATDNTSFAATYETGRWTGNLQAYAIDPNTGMVNQSAPVWASSAQGQLDERDWTTRKIATYSGTAGIAFTASALPGAQLARFNTPLALPGDAAAVVNFLRGDRSREETNYRVREHVLGDIVHADPVFVGPPSAGYTENGYAAFKKSRAARAKMIYQGSNDGMLHAFNAATGAEQWAYVPGLLVNAPYVIPQLGINFPGTSALVNLSRQIGFTHRYYVDGTPVVSDIDLAKTQGAGGASQWISLLVAGLNKGGRGYYALDVTDPSLVVSDATAAARVRWEFPNASTPAAVARNVGNTYGKPVIVKTQAAGWVTLVSSGYNNGADTVGDGQGHLFVLNAANGNMIADLSTGVGNAATPSGLAQLSAYVKFDNVDGLTDFVYGGDLQGNLWRFDLSSANTAEWNVRRLTTLVDAGGVPQPITTAPELANVGAIRTVYVGTGQYFGVSDLPNSPTSNTASKQGQTLYGLVDNATDNPTVTPLRTNLVEQKMTVSGMTASATSNQVDLFSKKGWYIDLPNQGERSVSSPSVALGTVSFATNIPTAELCSVGGSSWLYVVDYRTGGRVNDPNVTWSGMFVSKSLANRPTLTRLKSGKIVQLIRTNDVKTVAIVPPVAPKVYQGRRALWKEIITN